MAAISVSLPKAVAISFTRSLLQSDKYYLMKISENLAFGTLNRAEQMGLLPFNGTLKNCSIGELYLIAK